MQNIEANIELIRNEGVLTSVSVIMPVWHKVEDNIININIPLFGLKTVCKDDSEFDIAIEEALKCFCLTAEAFGDGLEAELQRIGWKSVNDKDLNFTIDSENDALEQILQTGEPYAHEFKLAA